jgi:hypothetical protein
MNGFRAALCCRAPVRFSQVYYTSTDLPVAEKLAKAFEAKYPGITVRVDRGSTPMAEPIWALGA